MTKKNKQKKSASAILWGSSWYILTILMNSVSLINLSRDLKIAVVNWTDFFLQSFQIVQNVVDFVFYPIQELLSFFNFPLPSDFKNFSFVYFLILFVFISSFIDQNKKEDRSMNLSWYVFKMKYKVFFYIYIPFVAATGILYYFLGSNALIFSLIILLLVAVLVYFLGENIFKKLIVNYLLTLVFLITVICLTNYYLITFN